MIRSCPIFGPMKAILLWNPRKSLGLFGGEFSQEERVARVERLSIGIESFGVRKIKHDEMFSLSFFKKKK